MATTSQVEIIHWQNCLVNQQQLMAANLQVLLQQNALE
jgi:hypothetical protein